MPIKTTGSTKDYIGQARQRLKTAREQWDQAAVHSWEPAEPAECITKCFYSFENALTAAILATGREPTTKHYQKAKMAAQLVKKGVLKTDISSRLNELNDLRKDVQYGEPGESLASADLEKIVSELEEFLDEVEKVVRDAEKAQSEEEA